MSSETYAMNDLKTRELEAPVATAIEALGSDNGVRMRVDELSVYYGKVQAVKQVSMAIRTHKVTGFHIIHRVGLATHWIYLLERPSSKRW